MIQISNIRTPLLTTALAGLLLATPSGCTTDPVADGQNASAASTDQTDQVITAEDVAGSGPDHHLVVDLRSGIRRFDASALAMDLKYMDIVGSSGQLLTMEQLLDLIATTNHVSLDDLAGGFSVQVIADQLRVSGASARGPAASEKAAQINLLGATDIGVIPNTRSCPVGSEAIVINMDDEDSGNNNSHDGWNGAIQSTANTSFFFCRVNGQQFRALTMQFNQTQHHYAVLKLGSTCPNGSLDFSRHFDNEDSGNTNSSMGNIAPNVSTANTTLRFCLFRSDNVIMNNFPNLGFSYGVFASSNFSKGINSGFVHTDDEDDSNTNSYAANAAWSAHAQLLVSSGANTTLNLSKVQ